MTIALYILAWLATGGLTAYALTYLESEKNSCTVGQLISFMLVGPIATALALVSIIAIAVDKIKFNKVVFKGKRK